MIEKCPVCNGGLIEVCSKPWRLPLSSAILLDRSDDEFNYRNFQLASCNSCGHIFNAEIFDPKELEIYNSKSYVVKSKIPGNMSSTLDRVFQFLFANIPNLKNKKILEIASGSGALAMQLASMGCDVTTVDPMILSYENSSIKHFSGYFDKNFSDSHPACFDLVIARHFLEHVDSPTSVLSEMLSMLKMDKTIAYVYIEVPNLDEIISSRRFFDFFNDHLQYFNFQSLSRCFQLVGVYSHAKLSLHNSSHMGFLISPTEHTPIGDSSVDFHTKPLLSADEITEIMENSFDRLIKRLDSYDSIVIYGAGAHCLTICSWLPTYILNRVVGIVDRDPQKTNKFIDGLKFSIVNPLDFDWTGVELVLNTAILYPQEVREFSKKWKNFAGDYIDAS